MKEKPRLSLVECDHNDRMHDYIITSPPFEPPKRLAIPPPSRRTLRDYFTYLMLSLNPHERLIKVGSSVDPKRRRTALQTGNPYRLDLFFTVRVIGRSCKSARDVSRAIEKNAQKILSQHREKQEWFDAPLDIASKVLIEATIGIRQQREFSYEFLSMPWQERFHLRAA